MSNPLPTASRGSLSNRGRSRLQYFPVSHYLLTEIAALARTLDSIRAAKASAAFESFEN